MFDQKTIDRFWNYVDKTSNPNGCWEWKRNLNNYGYGQFMINYKNYRSHRISWLIHYGNIPNKMLVLHLCNNRKCVNPSHLILGNQDKNIKYMVLCNRQSKGNCHYSRTNPEKLARGIKHGTYLHPELIRHGEQVGTSKLKKEQVIRIRELYKTKNYTQHQLAKLFNIARGTIQNVVTYITWKHV